MKTTFIALLSLSLLFIGGCRTSRGFKISGGSNEQAMVHGAFNSQIPYLHAQGFPKSKKPGSYTLYPSPSVKAPRRLRSGRMQGFLESNIYARASVSAMWYGLPLAVETCEHEVKHSALFAGGYHNESMSHDRRAFATGGVILAVGVEPYFPGCIHSEQLTIHDLAGYVLPLDAEPGVPYVVETMVIPGELIGMEQDQEVELVVIP